MIFTAEDYIRKGSEFEEAREYYEAINCYEKAIEFDPTNLTAWIKKGELHSYMTDIDEAMYSFSNVLKIEPTNQIALEYRLFFGEKC